MAQTDKIVKGLVILYNNEPHLIIEREFYKPGKGNAMHRTKLKNLRSGNVIAQTYKSGEKVDEISLDTRNMMYSYHDDEFVYLLDSETYEEAKVSLDMVHGGTKYLHSDGKYLVQFYEGSAINVQVPVKMTLEVTETSDAIKGNTSGNATKEAVLETGASVQVPLFIKLGDKIIINTENNEYYSKE